MSEKLLDEIRHLSVEDRVQLAEEIWNSIAEDEDEQLTPEQIAEVRRRFRAARVNPLRGSSWMQAKERILDSHS